MNKATAPQHKFCAHCGKQLHPLAEICTDCGVRAMSPPGNAVNKAALLAITFFFGGFGAHKFYLKKYLQGVFYLLFCWTLIPGLIAFVEFILYCIKSEAELQQHYPHTSGTAAALAAILPLVGAAVLGILAAIAIPQFIAYRQKASNSAALTDLKNCRSQTEGYYAGQHTYPTRSDQMTCGATTGVALYYLAMGNGAYQLIAFHRHGNSAYLAGNQETEISEKPRTEIESLIAGQLGIENSGGFHFIE